ncbi:MAG: class I SAM-dependent RNA methyltransferase [Candidatus Margulisbacteria bacterium]|nr:class I SAM-dependent RNA methyltransferase [Candidatus Margulisiibacteriota bacterium]
MRITLIATTTMGLESVLAKEIKDLGYQEVQVFDGKVEFSGDLSDICKANLWLRTAGRVYVKMAAFDAVTFDELYNQTVDIPWENWIQADDEFPVAQVTSLKSELFSKSTCQSIVKKAIVARLQEKHRVTHLPETGALCPIRIQIDKNHVILSLDTSGTGLHMRGYRVIPDGAPLKETLAAGLILLSRWRPTQDVLLDPLCGTGTILIEAGLMAKNIAPGLHRSFCSENWQLIPKKLWETARDNAHDSILKTSDFQIIGSDISNHAIRLANQGLIDAGLTTIIPKIIPVKDLISQHERGKIITNPPYGDRLGTEEEAAELYREMGDVFKTQFPRWSYYILTANEEFQSLFRRRSTKNRKLYNGGIKCHYYQYY